MPYPVYWVNAFTEQLFHGNPAAVVIVDDFPQEAFMQKIAHEFNLSETAFVKRLGFGKYAIRWFTPETEVYLCGHATLGAAKAMFHDLIPQEKLILFQSKAGELVASRQGDEISLDFPLDAPYKIEADDALLKNFGEAKAEEILYAPKTKNLMVVYSDAITVQALKPDFGKLALFRTDKISGIAVTAKSAGKYDYICRYFAPWEGINEDPVTGSAQTFLAPYWCARLGKKELTGSQVSARGGEFKVSVTEERVLISGKAIIFLKGELKRGF